MNDTFYTVSAITTQIKQMLEGSFDGITVEGEISNCRPSSTGHLYFTLKDEKAVLSAVMFKGRAGRLAFVPKDGMVVRASGNLSVYPPRGGYQLICEQMTRSGEGDILAMLEERKKRLAAEGLFDSARKRPIPWFPDRIAVVTSPTGAAVRDILQVLQRRNPNVRITILPAPVQGEGAGVKIAQQIRRAGRYALGEVVIIGRGGGSLEDLLPFSDEQVVRAVADSPVPVISAVGHETDISLSDLAADLRAPTPSAAAELATIPLQEVTDSIQSRKNQLLRAVKREIEKTRLLLDKFSPKNQQQTFRMILQPAVLRLDDAKESMLLALQNQLTGVKHKIQIAANKIEAANPANILKKGYAAVTKENTIITSVTDIARGDTLTIRFGDGEALTTVEETDEKEL